MQGLFRSERAGVPALGPPDGGAPFRLFAGIGPDRARSGLAVERPPKRPGRGPQHGVRERSPLWCFPPWLSLQTRYRQHVLRDRRSDDPRASFRSPSHTTPILEVYPRIAGEGAFYHSHVRAARCEEISINEYRAHRLMCECDSNNGGRSLLSRRFAMRACCSGAPLSRRLMRATSRGATCPLKHIKRSPDFFPEVAKKAAEAL